MTDNDYNDAVEAKTLISTLQTYYDELDDGTLPELNTLMASVPLLVRDTALADDIKLNVLSVIQTAIDGATATFTGI